MRRGGQLVSSALRGSSAYALWLGFRLAGLLLEVVE
jgi:hypothetical protein